MHQSKSLQLLLWGSALVQGLPAGQSSSGHDGLEARQAPHDIGFVTFKSKAHVHKFEKREAPDDIGFVTFTSKAHTHHYDKQKESSASSPNRRFVTFKMSSKKSALGNRANNYNVDPADKPTIKNAVGISQDGADYSYFVEANFGSEGKKLYMLFDTGSGTTWVMGSGCTTDACTRHNLYGPNDSKTYKDTGDDYSVQYGSGEVAGHVITDKINIGGLELTMPFGVANTTSDQFSQFPFEGILGMSLVDGTWLTELKKANLIDANVFGVALNRKADGVNDGEVAFGAPNKAKYTGDIAYTGLKSDNSWAIPMDDVSFGGKAAGVKGRLAYIDTGTTFVFGPPDDVANLYQLIPGSKTIDDREHWTVPCDTDGEVAFSFSGKTYAVSSKDFITAPDSSGTCYGRVFGMEFVEGAWLLGDMFMKNVYTVFDMDHRQIGFAARAHSSNGSSSSTSPSGTSTASPSGSATSGSATATDTSDGSSSAVPTGGAGVGLTPQESPAGSGSGSSTSPTESAPGSTNTPDSAGVKLSAMGIYTSLMCILVLGMVM